MHQRKMLPSYRFFQSASSLFPCLSFPNVKDISSTFPFASVNKPQATFTHATARTIVMVRTMRMYRNNFVANLPLPFLLILFRKNSSHHRNCSLNRRCKWTFKAHSRCAVCDYDLLLLLMDCIGTAYVVTFAQYKH